MTKNKKETIAERIERIDAANAAKARAELALLGPPRPDPKPQGREGYFNGHYTGLTWHGKKIVIPKNRWGW